jgi:hypothetical protein
MLANGVEVAFETIVRVWFPAELWVGGAVAFTAPVGVDDCPCP